MTLHLACAVTGNYLPHAATMLKSLLLHTPGVTACVHLLHDSGLAAGERERLAQMLATHGATLDCRDVSGRLPAGLVMARFSPAAWYRVLLPELLPEVPRVLYLDCDLLVLDSLLPVWDCDLAGKTVAAVTDVSHYAGLRAVVLGLPSAVSYFNSGVILFDLERMRRTDVAARIFAHAVGNAAVIQFPDQDSLNAVLYQERHPLPLRYNLQMACFNTAPHKLSLPVAEVRAAMAHPAAVHFTSAWKPWHYRCKHPLRSLYADYRRQTPWPEFELEGRTLKNLLLRPLPEDWASRLSQWRRDLGWA